MLPAGDTPKRVRVLPLAKALVLVGKLIPELQDATCFVEADAERFGAPAWLPTPSAIGSPCGRSTTSLSTFAQGSM
jgi:hypothetical protein